ncbi:MAG: hypothetical protein KatS3mg115_0220 [Candidatus Poribacteria bacterium]|nr:MAG: hypothetical protein KatS3mg115_0220 [Candidatus Poribacteria bacterium]
MNYLSPLANNFAYCLAVEKLLGLEVPKRGQYYRVILARAVPNRRPYGLARHPCVGHRRLHCLPVGVHATGEDLHDL